MAEKMTIKATLKTSVRATSERKTVEVFESTVEQVPVKKRSNDPTMVAKKKILFVASEARPFIATGGLAKVIVPLCKRDIIIDEDMLLKGLMYIYEKNK